MIRLLIKGTRQDAALALSRRDIPVLQDIAESRTHAECAARVHACYAGRVRAWFHETPVVPPPGGFPPGTLLYFHETELSELMG